MFLPARVGRYSSEVQQTGDRLLFVASAAVREQPNAGCARSAGRESSPDGSASTAGDLAARSRWPDTAGSWLSQGKSGLRSRPGQSGTTTRVVIPLTRTVGHADDPAPAVRGRYEDVNRVGGGAEDGADLGHGLERVQHVDGSLLGMPRCARRWRPGLDRGSRSARAGPLATAALRRALPTVRSCGTCRGRRCVPVPSQCLSASWRGSPPRWSPGPAGLAWPRGSLAWLRRYGR